MLYLKLGSIAREGGKKADFLVKNRIVFDKRQCYTREKPEYDEISVKLM